MRSVLLLTVENVTPLEYKVDFGTSPWFACDENRDNTTANVWTWSAMLIACMLFKTSHPLRLQSYSGVIFATKVNQNWYNCFDSVCCYNWTLPSDLSLEMEKDVNLFLRIGVFSLENRSFNCQLVSVCVRRRWHKLNITRNKNIVPCWTMHTGRILSHERPLRGWS